MTCTYNPWEQAGYAQNFDASLKHTRFGSRDNWRPYPSMIGMVQGVWGLLDAPVIYTGNARVAVTPGPWSGMVSATRFNQFSPQVIPGVFKVEGGE